MSGACKTGGMRRAFGNREELLDYLREQFPTAAARGGGFSVFHGGRRAALARLAGYDPGGYAASRNYLSGNVTRLSPYLRHGVIGLREVLDTLRSRDGGLVRARKLVQDSPGGITGGGYGRGLGTASGKTARLTKPAFTHPSIPTFSPATSKPLPPVSRAWTPSHAS